jgi:hypothetical protein
MNDKTNLQIRAIMSPLILMALLLISAPLSANESVILRSLASWLPAETLFDNTDQATSRPGNLDFPGWVMSGKAFKNDFGITFKTGPSEYLLRSVSFLVGAPEGAAEFEGDLKVSLFEVPVAEFPPADRPFYEATLKGVRIQSEKRYITLPLDLPRLKPGTWYAITLSAPNDAITEIMGYQVPARQPVPSLGFEMGVSLWGETQNWRSLGFPYIWLEGWDAASERYLHLRASADGVPWLLFGILVLCGLGWVLRHRAKK